MNTPPPRESTGLTQQELATTLPVQPSDADRDDAFNLALDKAEALLPENLRERAHGSLYTMAAMLHPVAVEDPSAAWPDAGGAGWVLDAVMDAREKGPIGSVQLIRSIITRWKGEGNPYSVEAQRRGTTLDETLLATVWELAGGDEPTRVEIQTMAALLESQQVDLVVLIQLLMELGRRGATVSLENVVSILEGRMSLPARIDDRYPEGPPVQPVVTEPLPGDSDPVLQRVIEWYLEEISRRTTPMVRDDLLDLTARQRDLDVWEYAFQLSRNIGSGKGRWNYITAVVTNPDMALIDKWVKAGKTTPRPEKKKRPREPGGGRGGKSQLVAEKPPAQEVDPEEVERLRQQLREHRKKRQEQTDEKAE